VKLNLLKDVRHAYSNLNPSDIRALSGKMASIGVIAGSEATFHYIKHFLQPAGGTVQQVAEGAGTQEFDVVICEPGLPCPAHSFVFHPRDTGRTVDEILDARSDIEVPLARNFLAFREPTVLRIVSRTAQENAFFSVVTALPNIVPTFLELPWAVGEFASDTAFITINQFRMAFLIAACHDRPVGYKEQKMELATIVAGAFGWRALARELVGKIPLGGGLIPKAAIAYAGSYVVGRGLDRLHRTGLPLSRSERRSAYGAALERGKNAVQSIVSQVKKRNVA
jgi:hypothetical protein